MFSSKEDSQEFMRVMREAGHQLSRTDTLLRRRLLDLCLNIPADTHPQQEAGYPRRLLLRFLLFSVVSIGPIVVYYLLGFLAAARPLFLDPQAPLGAEAW